MHYKKKNLIYLLKIYINLVNNKKLYKTMAKNTKDKVNKLSNTRIYQYLYKGIILNSLFINH